MNRQAGTIEPIGLAAGFALWGTAFVLLYALHGAGCTLLTERNWEAGGLRGILAGVLAVFIVAHLWLIRLHARRLAEPTGKPARFMRRAALALSTAALGATIWTAVPIATIRPCG